MSKSKPRGSKRKLPKDEQEFAAALNEMMNNVYAAMPKPSPKPKPKPAKSKQKWLNEFEQEWMEADNPAHFHGVMGVVVKISARRVRLAAVAGMRACGREFTPVQEAMATAAEQYADGEIGLDALKKAEAAVKPGKDDFANRIEQLGHRQASFALGGPAAALQTEFDCQHVLENRQDAERCRPVVAVFRDVFGNPFRPVKFDKRWRSETVVALAAGIYAERAFDRMPILADALEEAGCDHDEVLTHCRGPGPHVRGCWVVDGVLGKK